jgi:hypothetical protein
LVGANSELFSVTVGDIQKYSVSVFLQDTKIGFNWRLVVVYGSPYEEGKQEFLEELHKVMLSWQGPTLFGGDFNLVRNSTDKNNGNINHKWADAFNGWINGWGIIEINSSNKMYTWTNNQDTPVLAKLDRIIATTDWEANFPLSKVKTLDRIPSDHNPLLLDTGNNMSSPKKKFRLEKWWLENDNFKEVVTKAWLPSPRGKTN